MRPCVRLLLALAVPPPARRTRPGTTACSSWRTTSAPRWGVTATSGRRRRTSTASPPAASGSTAPTSSTPCATPAERRPPPRGRSCRRPAAKASRSSSSCLPRCAMRCQWFGGWSGRSGPAQRSRSQSQGRRTGGAGGRDTKPVTRYNAVLIGLDGQIGRLLDGPKGTTTLVPLPGDNGASPPFPRERGGGLRGQKLSPYEGGVRVPFGAWWPAKGTGGGVNEKTVTASADFVPTRAAVCAVEVPTDDSAAGVDLTAALMGETPARAKPPFREFGRNDPSYPSPQAAWHRSPNVAVRDGGLEPAGERRRDEGRVGRPVDGPGPGDEPRRRDAAVAERRTQAALNWRKCLP